MPVIDGKVAALGPDRDVFPCRWPCHVQYDADPVFVVVSLDTLVCVGCVRGDQAVSLGGKFCRLEVFERVEDWIRDLVVDIKKLLRALGSIRGCLVLRAVCA